MESRVISWTDFTVVCTQVAVVCLQVLILTRQFVYVITVKFAESTNTNKVSAGGAVDVLPSESI